MLKGKKTYLFAGLAVITAAVQYLVGDIGLADALQLAFSGVIGATIRHGISEAAVR